MTLLRLCLVLSLLVAAAGCSSMRFTRTDPVQTEPSCPTPPPVQTTPATAESQPPETESTPAKPPVPKDEQIAQMEERIKMLETRLDEAIQDVVRTKAGQRSTGTRAEAASQMAEAEIALTAFRDRISDGHAPELVEAERMMKMAAWEFEKENFDGTLYLTSQAKYQIRSGRWRIIEQQTEMVTDEMRFDEPMSLTVTRRSHLRRGPGKEFEILTTLDAGTALTGTANNGLWVRVVSADGLGGWIHQTLVASPR